MPATASPLDPVVVPQMALVRQAPQGLRPLRGVDQGGSVAYQVVLGGPVVPVLEDVPAPPPLEHGGAASGSRRQGRAIAPGERFAASEAACGVDNLVDFVEI